MNEYIGGWRRISAIFFLLQCIFKLNWDAAKRELEIIGGHAKPYKIIMTNDFVRDLKEIGFSEEEIDKIGERE